jgi:hypothetical protein
MSIFFGTSNPSLSNVIARRVAARTARKLASKIYTDDMRTPPEELIRRHRLEIVAHFYPGAVISHRSAIEARVSPGGKLHLTVHSSAPSKRALPGLEIRTWDGPPAQPDDIPMVSGGAGQLFTSSQARALLENLQIARARKNDEPKTLTQAELEQWLDKQIRFLGAQWLDQTIAQVETVAQRLGWTDEGSEFAAMAAAIKRQPSTVHLVSEEARARAQGTPFDPDRLTLFSLLHARLATETFLELPRPPAEEIENRAFWEAYFSNYIEGTKFTVDEAQAIIYTPREAADINQRRPQDAHDILETYRLIVDAHISRDCAQSVESFIDLLKRRHARMMASRLETKPGVFKDRPNSIGSTTFVAPDLVSETLQRGWPAVTSLQSATARALYMLFLVSEVHPFSDGNGRISRLFMNAELEASGHARLIIPTALRTDYLSVLGAMTLGDNPVPLVAFARKITQINKEIPFDSFERTREHFKKTGAMNEIPTTFNIAQVAQ